MKSAPNSWHIVLCVLLIMGACGSPRSDLNLTAVANMNDEVFKLYILNQNMPTCYKLESCWPILKQAPLENSIFVITEEDVETYDWSDQTITLTLEATNRLSNKLLGKPSSLSSDRVAFVVTLGGEWLYGGIFLDLSAQLYTFPLIFTDFSGNRAVFYLRPAALRDSVRNYLQFNSTERKLIEIDRVHDFFKRLGKLVE